MSIESQGNEVSGDAGSTSATEGTENAKEGSVSTGEGKGSSHVVPDVTGSLEKGAAVAAPEVPPAYVPNYKYKARDKEFEFDDWAKAAIKDQETEKKARDLFTRVKGVDIVIDDNKSLKNQNAEYQDKITSTDAALEQLGKYVATKDFDSFFGELKIPSEHILEYALKLAERQNWTPEQRAQWQASRDAVQRATSLEAENHQLKAGELKQLMSQREFELKTVMTKPEVSPAVQAYNSGMGHPGAFRDLVLQFGVAAEARGESPGAEELVAQAMRFLKGANPNIGLSPIGNTGQVVQGGSKPVIPNIQGRGTSPVKSTIKSLDDIKKLTREREAQGI